MKVLRDHLIELFSEIFSFGTVTFDAATGKNPTHAMGSAYSGQLSRAYDDVVAFILELGGHTATPLIDWGAYYSTPSQIG
jgi:hypothetical protein